MSGAMLDWLNFALFCVQWASVRLRDWTRRH